MELLRTRYERSCDGWARMLKQARALPDVDVRRHASVSTLNNHACVECFCCAAEVVRAERRIPPISHDS